MERCLRLAPTEFHNGHDHPTMLCLQRTPQFFGAILLSTALTAPAQVLSISKFTASKPDPGWVFGGKPGLTAPGIDPEGSGWLRLTGSEAASASIALNAGTTFNLATGATLSFTYASWGGGAPGGDGLSVFLYDAAATMAGSSPGGGLGYCKGGGGWLGLGLDEFGNFSNPQDACAGSGPGIAPQSVALRGPAPSGNRFIANAAVPGNIDRPQSKTRAGIGQVALTVLPKPAGHSVTVDWRSGTSGAWTRLMNQVNFAFAAPASLRVGVAASAGVARNIHEIRDIVLRVHVPVVASQSFSPPAIARGGVSTWVLQLATRNNMPAVLTQPFVHQFPPGMSVANPPHLGGSCPGVMQAPAGSPVVTLTAGSAVRGGGCTLSVDVTSASAGTLTSTVAPFSIATDAGFNLSPSSAALTVRP
jgi:hypothetical protein